jgi:hypothetical protein
MYKAAVESNDITSILNFVKIGQLVPSWKGAHAHTKIAL